MTDHIIGRISGIRGEFGSGLAQITITDLEGDNVVLHIENGFGLRQLLGSNITFETLLGIEFDGVLLTSFEVLDEDTLGPIDPARFEEHEIQERIADERADALLGEPNPSED